MLLAHSLSGLGDAYNNCLIANCDRLADVDSYAACSQACQRSTGGSPGPFVDPKFDACDVQCNGDLACMDVCTGVPLTSTVTSAGGTVNTFENLPGALQPGAGYQVNPATNWYKVAGIAVIGLSALVAGIFYARSVHAS